MTVISRRILTPLPGKSELALDRAKRLAGIIARLGGVARTVRVVSGGDVGNIEIFSRFQDFTAATRTNAAIAADPEMLALWKERERDPAATPEGPYVYRTVWGEVSRQPVIVQREYQVSRQNLPDLMALLPEAHAAVNKLPMVASIPVFAPQMDRLVVGYYAESIEAMGRNLDQYAMGEAFQAVVQKAARFGTVITARVVAEV
ncbi:hypothetical protein [Ramlibacter albus]|uniref:NIPSNAP family protein n=1 Tax=Ramlibacter albus TaxID=2079448 RepID=A0A923S550_9BURK|nr:hypothetical protein [Ramlibacter albus]MBC5768200.1 hypothetical protein [Ramlibacter albus]